MQFILFILTNVGKYFNKNIKVIKRV